MLYAPHRASGAVGLPLGREQHRPYTLLFGDDVSDRAKLPFLPFYLNDWENDEKVKIMGPATRYIYLHLLMHQWREGSIPSDKKLLLRILQFPHDPVCGCPGYAPIDSEQTGLTEEQLTDHFDLSAALEDVLKCFNSDGRGHLRNKRMEVLRLRHLATKCNFSARGKAGRMKQLLATAHAQAGESESDTESESERHTAKPPRKPKPLAPIVELPEGIKRENWDAFVLMRKSIKKPLTEHGSQLAINKLCQFRARGYDPNEILNESTMNCWQGLFEPKNGGNGNGKHRETSEEKQRRLVVEMLAEDNEYQPTA